MARNIVGRKGESEVPESKAPEEGGTSGKPEDTSAAEKNITMPGSRVVGSAKTETDSPVTVAQHYRVKHETSVMYEGYRSTMKAGKVINDSHVDIEALKKQGVQLEECDAPEPTEYTY